MDYKFRGKRIDNDEWVYGYYVAYSIPISDCPRFKVEHRIYTHLDEADCSVYYEVHPESVGLWTGYKDKNKVDIYQGHTIMPSERKVCFGEFHGPCGKGTGFYTIAGAFGDGAMVGENFEGPAFSFTSIQAEDCEVIGNTTDNPELLKK